MGLPIPLGRRGIVSVVALASSLVLATSMAVPAQAAPKPPSATPTSTAQIDGVAFAQVVVGSTVYVGGTFSKARPAGAAAGKSTTTRTNLLAYDVNTGALKSWAPSTNGQVRTMVASQDGSKLYLGGYFTTVNGQPRSRIAAVSTSSGSLISSFAPTLNSTVTGLGRKESTIYAVGSFTSASGSTRSRAAAFNGSSGSLKSWAPKADDSVLAVVASGSGYGVVLGGRFSTMNGQTAPGSQRVDDSSGKNLPWAVNQVVKNRGADAAIYSLDSDGSNVFGTGYQYNASVSGKLEGAFKATWTAGTLKWLADCHGDTYSVDAAAGSAVFVAGHAHDCSNIDGFKESNPISYRRALAFDQEAHGTVNTNRVDPDRYSNFGGKPAARLLDWYPSFNAGTATGQNQGPWDVVVADKYVLYAGEFTKVGGVSQQGLVRFKR